MALGSTQPPNRNEYQEYFLEERRPVRRTDNFTAFMCQPSGNLRALTFWNPHGPCRDCFTFYFPFLVS
jgi:hypothetical protein